MKKGSVTGQSTADTLRAETMDISSSNEDSDIPTDSSVKRCSYCNKEKLLVTGKSYCSDCNKNCFRECRRCKRPYHDKKYYAYSETRCNSCHKKYLKERAKREEKKRKAEDTEGREEIPVEAKRKLKSSTRKVAGYIPVFLFSQDEAECE